MPNAVIAIGTSWRFSARRVAVTMMFASSSLCALGAGSVAGGVGGSCAKAVPVPQSMVEASRPKVDERRMSLSPENSRVQSSYCFGGPSN